MERGHGARLSDIRRFFQPRPGDVSSSAAASREDKAVVRESASLQTAADAKKKAAGVSSPPPPAAASRTAGGAAAARKPAAAARKPAAAARKPAAAARKPAAAAARKPAAAAAGEVNSSSSTTEASNTKRKTAASSPRKRRDVNSAATTTTPDSNISSKQDIQPIHSPALLASDVSWMSPAADAPSSALPAKRQQQQQRQSPHAQQHACRQDKTLSPRQQQVSAGDKDASLREEALSGAGSSSSSQRKKKSWRRLRGGGGAGDASCDEEREGKTGEDVGRDETSSKRSTEEPQRDVISEETTQLKEPQQQSIRGLLKSERRTATAGSASSSSSSSGFLRAREDSNSSAAKNRSSATAAAATTVKQQVTDIDAFFANALEEDLQKAKKTTTGKTAAATARDGATAAGAAAVPLARGAAGAVDPAAAAETQQAKENESSSKPGRHRSSSTKNEAAEWSRLLQSMTPARVRQQQQQQHGRTVSPSSEDEEEEREVKTTSKKEESSNERTRKRGGVTTGQHKRREASKQGSSSKQTAEGPAAQRIRRRSSDASSADEEYVLSSDSSSSSPSSTSDEEEEEKQERLRKKKKKKQGGEGQAGATSPRKKTQQKGQQPPAAAAASGKAAGEVHFTSKTVAGALNGAKTENSNKMSSDSKEENTRTDSLPLAGKTFVFTGVLDSLGREEAAAIVMRLGGRCTSAVSGRTDYLVMGGVLEDGREVTSGSKYRKAVQQQQQGLSSSSSSSSSKAAVGGIKIIRETEFLSLLPPGTVAAAAAAASQAPEAAVPGPLLPFAAAIASRGAPAAAAEAMPSATVSSSSRELQLWAEKYRPSSSQQIVGNKEQLRTLHTWLTDWKEVCLLGKKKPPPPRSFTPSYSPFGFAPQLNMNARAALLSGPPGIGKTTAARVAAQEAGFTVVELNASDTRNKSHVEGLGDMTSGGHTLHAFFHSKADALMCARDAPFGRHARPVSPGEQQQHSMADVCLLMDEVDGLSGGDRGGAQAIVKLIENSKCPLICVCNDRMNPKVRTLASKCLDLRFSPPHKSALRQRVGAIAAAEKLPLDAAAIDGLVEAAGGDMRQILNNMQLLSYDLKSATAAEEAKGKPALQQQQSSAPSAPLSVRGLGVKDEQVLYGPFECCKQLLDVHQAASLSLSQKLDRFFVDYDMLPLLIQENYIEAFRQGAAPVASPLHNAAAPQYRGRAAAAVPTQQKQQQQQQDTAIRLTAAAAMDISEADIMNSVLRGIQAWSLLPDIGFLFCVAIPAKLQQLSPTACIGRVQFPSWLGRNSTQTKNKRLFTELLLQLMRKPCCCSSASGLKLTGYLDALYQKCLAPLMRQKKQKTEERTTDEEKSKEKAIEHVLQEMDVYGLTRDMLLENLHALRLKSEPALYDMVDSKTKTAFTRTYNRTVAGKEMLISSICKRKKGKQTPATVGLGEREEEEEGGEEEEEEEEEDPLIVKSSRSSKRTKSSNASKARGGGGAAAAGRKRSKPTAEGQKTAAESGKNKRRKKKDSP